MFSLEGGHHSGDGALVTFLPLDVLGFLAELAELFIEVQTNIEVEIVTLFVFVHQGDTLEVHIGVLDHFPSNANEKIRPLVNREKKKKFKGKIRKISPSPLLARLPISKIRKQRFLIFFC